MHDHKKSQLAVLVDQTDPHAILHEVKKTFKLTYDAAAFVRIEEAFKLICALFRGDFPGYLKCNTEYHDLSHTLDAFLAASRLIDGAAAHDVELTAERAELSLLAALFHDTGYIQESEDDEGTGAKYTKNHVERSNTFVCKNAGLFTLSPGETEYICTLIACTELSFDLSTLETAHPQDLTAGRIIGTADLLGQMSDRTYLEKLLFLYYEFREGGIQGFDTEYDILRKTMSFYTMTMKRLDTTLGQVYRFAAEHFRARFGISQNLYIEAIERHMSYLAEIIADESTNFRKKLKRLDIDSIEKKYQYPHH